MIIAFATVSAIVPSLLLLWYFHSRDTFREPPRVVWTTFALGALSIVPALIFAAPFMLLLDGGRGGNALVLGFVRAFFGAAIPEEAAKLCVLALYAGRHSTFDEPMDGLVYGAAASLGFATLENVLYCADGGVGLAVIRALTAVPVHAGCGALMGYFYGRSRFDSGRRTRLLGVAYFLPMLLHGLYDFPILTLKQLLGGGARPPLPIGAGLICFAVFFVLVVVIGALVVVRSARREQVVRGEPKPMPPRGPTPETTASIVVGITLLAIGAITSTMGGSFLLALALLLVTKGVAGGETGAISAIVLFGVLPLIVGLVAYRLAIRILNRRRATA